MLSEISIRAPARGATCFALFLCMIHIYFNPRSREGSDFNISKFFGLEIISIRAPARGAT